MIEFLLIVLGLVVGSFLNAVIYRLKVEVSFLKGRSYCPFCKHNLRAVDLVPLLSFIALRGRCRYCTKKISWQYPLVELGTMVAFLLLYWHFGLTNDFFVYLVYSCILMVVFVYDLRYYLILDRVSLPAIALAAILSIFVLQISVLHVLIGAVLGGGFFLLQFLVSRGRWIGGGDIRLGVVMGAMLGYPNVLVALFIAYILGSVIGVFLILSGRKKWQSRVPFGTFLSVATFLAFLFADTIIQFYRGML